MSGARSTAQRNLVLWSVKFTIIGRVNSTLRFGDPTIHEIALYDTKTGDNVREYRRWVFFFVVVGTNSITIYLTENQNLAYKLVKKAHINHISLDLFFLIRKNSLKAGVKYAQDYWPNKAACIERRRFPRNDSRHKQAKK